MTEREPEEEYTIFGYGSLIWKVGTAEKYAFSLYTNPHSGHVYNRAISSHHHMSSNGHYVRRFAQSSSDHRGTPEFPGRVVTLIHADEWAHFNSQDAFPHEDTVWGVAYTIDPIYAKEVKEYLGELESELWGLNEYLHDCRIDYREKDGYTIHRVDVYGINDGTEFVAVSQATVNIKESLLKGRQLVQNHSIILPSEYLKVSDHQDYLMELSKAVRELAPDSRDSHLEQLEIRVKELERLHTQTSS
ncbi:14126_t:CDS:2 [Acaulospora colombiana]|uniref:14126_t:CDS:1 n=1 Tax=Acaulospora colombiana TaxID=27376 RepID=A0ACA9PX10_9GLOM|nr:14126_t:CDS:2 [Acaulospora colombiana]